MANRFGDEAQQTAGANRFGDTPAQAVPGMEKLGGTPPGIQKPAAPPMQEEHPPGFLERFGQTVNPVNWAKSIGGLPHMPDPMSMYAGAEQKPVNPPAASGDTMGDVVKRNIPGAEDLANQNYPGLAGTAVGFAGLAALGKVGPKVAKGLPDAATALKAGVKAAAPDMAAGTAAMGAGVVGSTAMHGMGLPGYAAAAPTILATWPGARMIGRGIKAGIGAAREAVPAARLAREEAAMGPMRFEESPPPNPNIEPAPLATAAKRSAPPSIESDPLFQKLSPEMQAKLREEVKPGERIGLPSEPIVRTASPAPAPAVPEPPAATTRPVASALQGKPNAMEAAKALNREMYGTEEPVKLGDESPENGWPAPEVWAAAQRPFKAMNLAQPLHEAGVPWTDIENATPEQMKPFVRAIGQNNTGDISPKTIGMTAAEMGRLQMPQGEALPVRPLAKPGPEVRPLGGGPAPITGKPTLPQARQEPVANASTMAAQGTQGTQLSPKSPAPEPAKSQPSLEQTIASKPITNLVEERAAATDKEAFDAEVLRLADEGKIRLSTRDNGSIKGGVPDDKSPGKEYVSAQPVKPEPAKPQARKPRKPKP